MTALRASTAALALLFAESVHAQARDTLALTLEEAVARGVSQSDEARIAAAQTDLADAQVTVARASGLPQVRLNASQQHVMESARAQAVGQVFNQPNTYTANTSISQPLFQGGRILAASRAAGRLRSAARFAETHTRDEIAFEVQRAYMQALFSSRLAEIQGEAHRLAGERVALAQQFERAGRSARYDVLRARVEQANIEPQVIQARSDAEQAELELKRLINVPAGQPVRLVTNVDGALIERMVSRAAAAAASGAAVANRASVRAAELNAQARREAVAVARADYLPSVTLNSQLGFMAFPRSGFPRGSGRLEEIPCPPGTPEGRVCTQQNGGWFGDRSVGVSVSWPIFQGFRTRGNVALARAQARLAELELAQTRERASIELERARDEMERARATYEARRGTVSEAEEAFRLASLRFSRGLATQLEVSDAQLALTTAQTSEARARFDLYLAAAALARAAGDKPVPDDSFYRAR